MRRALSTGVSIAALIVGVGTMAFGIARLLDGNVSNVAGIATPLGAIVLGLLCWTAGVRIAKMGGRPGH